MVGGRQAEVVWGQVQKDPERQAQETELDSRSNGEATKDEEA